MRIAVSHRSRYEYDVPVSLGQHVIRLLPQAPTLTQRVDIAPQPTIQEERFDEFGNRVLSVSFSGQTQSLAIESHFELEANPQPELQLAPLRLPLNPGDPALLAFQRYDALETSLLEFSNRLAHLAGYQAQAFAELLTRELYQRIDRRVRLEGAAQSPSETLEKGQGACRDLTVLFLAACRAQGLAARFVSGYQVAVETADGQRYLHAWPEVYFPGYGWRGYDPTHGVAADAGHIALCAAPDQAATMPVEGGFSFFGPTVNSTLTFSVDVRVLRG